MIYCKIAKLLPLTESNINEKLHFWETKILKTPKYTRKVLLNNKHQSQNTNTINYGRAPIPCVVCNSVEDGSGKKNNKNDSVAKLGVIDKSS